MKYVGQVITVSCGRWLSGRIRSSALVRDSTMHTLQDVMTAQVITVAPEQPVGDALGIMEQRRISVLVVVRNRKPQGVLTERALIQIRVNKEIDCSWPVSRIMSCPPLTAPVDTDYREAYQLLLHNRVRHLVVTDQEGRLAGIVTGTDFLSHLGLEYFMEFKTVGQVMNRDVVSLPSTVSAFSAMKLMNDRRISSLVIEKDDYPEGILTERDLLRLIRSRVNLETVHLQEVMSRPVQAVFSDVSSYKAARIILKKGLRRLVVTNSGGRCVGIITETDLVKGLRTNYTDHLKDVIQQQARQLREIRQQMEEACILDSMLQSAGDIAIAIMDSDLRFLQHNRAAARLFRFPDGKMIGCDATRLHEAVGGAESFEQAVAAANEKGRHEFMLRQETGGAVRYLTTTIFSILNRDDVKLGYGLIALDVTEQKEYEASLQVERDFSKKTIDATPAIICSITRNGTIRFINPAGEQLTGYSGAELLGKNWLDYFHAGTTGQQAKKMLEKFRQQDVRSCEVQMRTKDGEVRDLSWSSVRRFSEKGSFSEILVLGNDITGLKRVVQALEKKKKEAEEANIALKVMLDQHTRTRKSIEEQISIRLKELVNPYLDLLRQSAASEQQMETIKIIAAHIDSITRTFSPRAREILLALSPRETMIADLIRQGKTSKDIAGILAISPRTVETYRNNLRHKLGINKKKISLRTYLITRFSD